MKKKFSFRLLVSLLFLIFGSQLFAQDIKELPSVTVTSSSNVNEKVTKSFKSYFSDVTNASWSKINRNYLVKFIMNDQKNTALFAKGGSLIYHITYGHEKHLPDNIRKLVKSNYVDFNIVSAIKVVQYERNVWVVTLEDSKKIILVRFEDGEMEEVNNLDKAS